MAILELPARHAIVQQNVPLLGDWRLLEITTLILVGFFGAIIAARLGRYWAFGKKWYWVDILYYPLAIVGVVVFFIADADARKTQWLLDELGEQRTYLAAKEAKLSEYQIASFERSTFDKGKEVARRLHNDATACSGQPGNSSVCAVYTTFHVSVRAVLVKIKSYRGPEDLGELCHAANEALAQLKKEPNLSPRITADLSTHFQEGRHRGFAANDRTGVQDYVEQFRDRIEKSSPLQVQLGEASSERSAPKAAELDPLASPASYLLEAISPCLRAPSNLLDGSYADAVADVENARAKEMAIEARIKETNEASNWLKQWAHLLWPYIFIGALLLKVSKAFGAWRRESQKSG